MTSTAPIERSAIIWIASSTGSSGAIACTAGGLTPSSSLTVAIDPSTPFRRTRGADPVALHGTPAHVGRAAELCRLALDPAGAPRDVRRRRAGTQRAGIGQHRREQRRLAPGQRPRGLAEMPLRRGLRAVDARSELGDVEIDLEDPL